MNNQHASEIQLVDVTNGQKFPSAPPGLILLTWSTAIHMVANKGARLAAS